MWVCVTFGDVSLLLARGALSNRKMHEDSHEGGSFPLHRLQHPLAQQCESGTPIHHSLDELEPVDLALNRPITDFTFQGSGNGQPIPFHADGYPPTLGNPALLHRSQPCEEPISFAFVQHGGKLADQCDSQSKLGMCLEDTVTDRLLLFGQSLLRQEYRPTNLPRAGQWGSGGGRGQTRPLGFAATDNLYSFTMRMPQELPPAESTKDTL